MSAGPKAHTPCLLRRRAIRCTSSIRNGVRSGPGGSGECPRIVEPPVARYAVSAVHRGEGDARHQRPQLTDAKCHVRQKVNANRPECADQARNRLADRSVVVHSREMATAFRLIESAPVRCRAVDAPRGAVSGQR